jgi:signal transduction histidine kinase
VRDDHGDSGEVAELAQTFNRMAASLQENRDALRHQNAELESRGAELVDAVRSAREGASVLRAVLDATPDAIALLDRDGHAIVDNPPMRAVRAAFGARATAIDQDGTLVPLDAAAAGNQGREARDEITLLGTRRAFARYATPVRDGHGRQIGRLLVLREVTGEREAERVKEEFFALVSHELRTPLTAILGYVELVLGEHSHPDTDAAEQHRYLEIVERNAQRLLRLVGDLLFAAQVESGSLLLEPEVVDLAQITREAVEAARPRAEDAGILLGAQIDPLPPSVGDRDRIAQVLDNLISNALKFTPGGGHVEVRLCTEGDDARLDVADTGVGVPPEEQARLFDRFFRASNATTRAVPGVGLGLMIVRAIVAAHGGTISVASEVDAGTTFTVRLPLQAAAAPDSGRAYSDSTGGRNPRYRPETPLAG